MASPSFLRAWGTVWLFSGVSMWVWLLKLSLGCILHCIYPFYLLTNAYVALRCRYEVCTLVRVPASRLLGQRIHQSKKKFLTDFQNDFTCIFQIECLLFWILFSTTDRYLDTSWNTQCNIHLGSPSVPGCSISCIDIQENLPWSWRKHQGGGEIL